jgi:serine/threonine protein phosphatase PrpC
MSLSLRYAARSHVGLIRDGNEDSGYAGPRLLMIADGMGGQAAGELASSVAVQTLAQLDSSSSNETLEDPIEQLSARIYEAHTRLRAMVAENSQLEGMGTTLTALLFAHGQLAMAHIGDSRAYRLREGRFEQLTTDHTWVQRLVDEGRISAEEAGHHPQRSLLMRALDGRGQAEPDLTIIDVQVGDRFMLCSDGLCGVVSFETIESAVAGQADIHAVAESLIQLALRGGGPDNITCIVADIVQDYPATYLGNEAGRSGQYPAATAQAATTQYLEMPMAVGAAAEHGPGGLPVFGSSTPTAAAVPNARAGQPMQAATLDDAVPQDTPASRAARLRRKSSAEPGTKQGTKAASKQGPKSGGSAAASAQERGTEPDGTEWTKADRRRRWRRPVIIGGVTVLLVCAAAGGGYYWTQQQYFVGDSNGEVAIYQGIDTTLAGYKLSHVISTNPKIVVADLPTVKQGQVRNSITASSLTNAQSIVATLKTAEQLCTLPLSIPLPVGGVTATPTASSSPTTSPSNGTPSSPLSNSPLSSSPLSSTPTMSPTPPATGAADGSRPLAGASPGAPTVSPAPTAGASGCPDLTGG